MKQIKVLGVFAIALALGLTACGGSKGSKSEQKSETPSSVASSEAPAESSAAPADSSEAPVESSSIAPCSKHTWGDYVETTPATCTVDGVQTRTCSVCGATQTKAIKAAHTWGEWKDTKAATCSEEGKQERECSVCHEKEEKPISKLAHTLSEILPADDNDVPEGGQKAKAATCTEAGVKVEKCSVCGARVETPISALNHDWARATDQSGALAATCTEPGFDIEECSRCHETRRVTTKAIGHDFPTTGTDLPIPGAEEKNTKGEIPFHWAKITNYSCTRGDSYRYAWSAKEVNFDYQNEGVKWTQEEIDAASEGDPAYGKTTSQWKSEPNLLDEGDGIRFWGRPIGNAMVLSSEGRASSNNDEKIPDESVKGSRFEFDFVFDTDVNDVCLSADLEPAQHTNDVFKNRPQDQEWTPGYKFVDDDNDPETPKVAEKIEGMRFIIYLDGVEVPLDGSVNTAPNGRRWYQFPCKLNLTAGKHNLNIAMAGGYLHTFYSFSFEKVAPAHEHNFVAGPAQQDEVESKVMDCPCGVEQIRWDAKKFNTTASSTSVQTNQATGVSADTNTGIKLNGDVYNKTSGTASDGCHVDYNVNVPAAKQGAKLLIKGVRNSSSNASMFSAMSGDQSPSYYQKADETWGKYEWRYKLFINDVEIEFTEYTTENPEPQTGTKVYFEAEFPCTFNLNAGVNKVQLQKWGGYTVIITELAFEYEA